MTAKMKTIAITAYKRPHYFERLINSLIQNDLHDWEIYIQLEPNNKEPYFLEIAERLLKPYDYFIGINQTVLGIRDNPYNMLDKVFISGALCCIYLEEDLIVSPDMTQVANWYLKQDHQNIIALNLIMGGCNSAGFISCSSEVSSFLKTNMINSLGLIFTREQWGLHIKPNWYNPAGHALNYQGVPYNGWDLSLYDYLLFNPELFVLQPLCARVTHRGEEDATNTTKEFQNLAFTGLEIYDGAPLTDYTICYDLGPLPYSLRSHLNLWHELTTALITLKKVNTARVLLEIRHTQSVELAQLKAKIDDAHLLIEKIYHSKSWRLTLPLRWLKMKYRRALKNKLFAWVRNTRIINEKR